MWTDGLDKRSFDPDLGSTAKQYLSDGVFTKAADLDAPRFVNLIFQNSAKGSADQKVVR
jgi:hypothetical protein